MIEPSLNLRPETDIGTFPLDCFPKYLVDFVNDIHKSTGKNRLMTIGALISAFATANGKFYQIKAGTYHEKTIFWVAIVAPSGIGKTPAMKPILQPFIDYNREQILKEEMEGVKAFRRASVNDATLEALLKVHGHNKFGLLLEHDELENFFASMGLYRGNNKNGGAADISAYNSLFNGRHVEKIRVKSESLSMHETCLNILGGLQPKKIKQYLGDQADNGFIFRFLPLIINEDYPPVNLNAMIPRNWEYREAIMDLMRLREDFGGLPAEPIDLEPGAEGLKVIEDYLNKIQGWKNDHKGTQVAPMYSKLEYYFIRFCLLMEIMHHPKPNKISMDSIERAKRLFEWFVDQSLSFLSMAKGGKTVAPSKFELWLRSKMKPGVEYKRKQIVAMLAEGFPDLSPGYLTKTFVLSSGSYLKKSEGTNGFYQLIPADDEL